MHFSGSLHGHLRFHLHRFFFEDRHEHRIGIDVIYGYPYIMCLVLLIYRVNH